MPRRSLYKFMQRHFSTRMRFGEEHPDGSVTFDSDVSWASLRETIAWNKAHPVRAKVFSYYMKLTKSPKSRYYSQIYWPVRTTYERLTRGWARRDVWSIDGYLDRIIPEMLECLRDQGHGYPSEFSEEPYGDGTGVERWNEILNTMIRGFRAHAEACNMDYLEDGERWEAEIHMPREEALQKEFKKGMKLFVKYYSHLWD